MIYVHPTSRERQQLLHAGAFKQLLKDYSAGQRQQLIEHSDHDGQRSLFTTDVGALLKQQELFEPGANASVIVPPGKYSAAYHGHIPLRCGRPASLSTAAGPAPLS